MAQVVLTSFATASLSSPKTLSFLMERLYELWLAVGKVSPSQIRSKTPNFAKRRLRPRRSMSENESNGWIRCSFRSRGYYNNSSERSEERRVGKECRSREAQ